MEDEAQTFTIMFLLILLQFWQLRKDLYVILLWLFRTIRPSWEDTARRPISCKNTGRGMANILL